MSTAPRPEDVYERAAAEGRRRMSMPMGEQMATAFIAGVTIVFGILAMGILHSLVAPAWGDGPGAVAGAVGFGLGFIFVVTGRTELFSENFFDPVAAAIEDRGRSSSTRLLSLWGSTLALNLIGGMVLVGLLTVDGALSADAIDALVATSERISSQVWSATLARAVIAGALITLMSYMLAASDSDVARMVVAFTVGFVLALGLFDHVVVTALHLILGTWIGGSPTYAHIAAHLGLSLAGNLVGGLFLITLTHTAQVKASRRTE